METRYVDLLSGDVVLSDQYRRKLIQNMLWKVEAKWTYEPVHKEECSSEDDKCICRLSYKKLDIVDKFNLQELRTISHENLMSCMKIYCIRLSRKLEPKKRLDFIKGFNAAVSVLFSKLKDNNLLFFSGKTRHGGLIFGYNEPRSECPTLLYFAHGLVDSKDFNSCLHSQIPRPSYHGYLASYEGLPKSSFFSSSHKIIPQDNLEAHKTIYQDLLTGDVVLSDLFEKSPKLSGMLWEVKEKLTRKRKKTDGIDINHNMAASIIDMFGLKEIPAFTRRQLLAFMDVYYIRIYGLIGTERKKIFLKGLDGAMEYLFFKFEDLKFFTGGSMVETVEGTLIFQVGGEDPKFLYIAPGLIEV